MKVLVILKLMINLFKNLGDKIMDYYTSLTAYEEQRKLLQKINRNIIMLMMKIDKLLKSLDKEKK